MSTFLRSRPTPASSYLACSHLPPLRAACNAQAPTSAKPPTSSTASGFSIETEMLTYRALESNGEAIACDVAAYLYGTKPDFKNLPTGAICNVGSSTPSNIGVVVLPFDRTVFSDFMIWRSDMQTMAEFEQRGANACEAPKPVAEAPANPSAAWAAAQPRPHFVHRQHDRRGRRSHGRNDARRRYALHRPGHPRPLRQEPGSRARRRNHRGPGVHGQRQPRTPRRQHHRHHARRLHSLRAHLH